TRTLARVPRPRRGFACLPSRLRACAVAWAQSWRGIGGVIAWRSERRTRSMTGCYLAALHVTGERAPHPAEFEPRQYDAGIRGGGRFRPAFHGFASVPARFAARLSPVPG